MTKAPDIKNKNMKPVKKQAAQTPGEKQPLKCLGISPEGKSLFNSDTEIVSYVSAKAWSGRTSSVAVPNMISGIKGSTPDGIAGIYCRVSRRPSVIDDLGVTESDSGGVEIDKTRNHFFRQTARRLRK
ncbi:MAG: hypothetical protein GY761_16450 [Hyphomicrobiales bacterium]|nr:hypothetical protein [Hyphomicrobiales bacterium]